MIPMPTSRVFRSRRGALLWSFWVIVAAVMTVGFGDAPSQPANTAASKQASDASVTVGEDAAIRDALRAMNAS